MLENKREEEKKKKLWSWKKLETENVKYTFK